MMKSKFLTVCMPVIAVLFYMDCAAQSGYEDSVKKSTQILNIEQSLDDAIATGDTEIWKKYLGEKFFVVTEDGERLDRAPFIATMSPLPKGYGGYIKVTEPKLSFYENTAVLSYVADEHETVFGQKLHTKYGIMETYTKKDTLWQIIAMQVFEIPQLPPEIKLPDEILKKYTGTYQLTEGTTYVVTLEQNHLFGQKAGRKKEELSPETENIFFRKSDARGRKIFMKDESGKMKMLERRNGNDLVWKKVAD